VRVLTVILFNFLLLASVFLSGSKAAYCIVAVGSSTSSFANSCIPIPIFTIKSDYIQLAHSDSTYTTQNGAANYSESRVQETLFGNVSNTHVTSISVKQRPPIIKINR